MSLFDRFSDLFMRHMKLFLLVMFAMAGGSFVWFTLMCVSIIPLSTGNINSPTTYLISGEILRSEMSHFLSIKFIVRMKFRCKHLHIQMKITRILYNNIKSNETIWFYINCTYRYIKLRYGDIAMANTYIFFIC